MYTVQTFQDHQIYYGSSDRRYSCIQHADADFDPNLVSVYFASESDSILVCENGCSIEFDETKAKEILLKDTVKININLHSGNASATAWGCDLTYDYVKINGEYRS